MNNIDEATKDKIRELLKDADETTLMFTMLFTLFSVYGVDIDKLKEDLKK